MPGAVLLIVYALAVARLTGLAVTDEISRAVREHIVDTVSPQRRRLRRYLAYALIGVREGDAAGCPWCASVWIAAACAPLIYYHHDHPAVLIPALALAFSQVTGMVSDLGRR